jgi:hypothetical protein
VSFHLYERDLEAATEVVQCKDVISPFELGPLLDFTCDADEFMRTARTLLAKRTVPDCDVTPSVAWYEARLP